MFSIGVVRRILGLMFYNQLSIMFHMVKCVDCDRLYTYMVSYDILAFGSCDMECDIEISKWLYVACRVLQSRVMLSFVLVMPFVFMFVMTSWPPQNTCIRATVNWFSLAIVLSTLVLSLTLHFDIFPCVTMARTRTGKGKSMAKPKFVLLTQVTRYYNWRSKFIDKLLNVPRNIHKWIIV